MTTLLDDAVLWKTVEEFNWASLSKKSGDEQDIVKIRFTKKNDPEFIVAFRDSLSKKHNALYKAIERWERDNGSSCELGDDGFGDLIWHIIGLGKEEYEKSLEDPSHAHRRALKHDFRECFSYVIPYKSDVLDKDNNFKTFAARNKAELQKFCEHPMLKDIFPSAGGDTLLRDLDRIIAGEKRILSAEQAKSLVLELQNIILGIEKKMSVHVVLRVEESGGLLYESRSFTPHGIINLYHDMEVYDAANS